MAFSRSDRSEVYLGEENAVTLTFNARNEGEGGAYEAELYVALPSEADYSGILRNNGVSYTIWWWLRATALIFSSEVVKPPQVEPPTSDRMMVFFRLRQNFTQLTCSYEAENQTRYLVCDLGNPMKSGTSVRTQHVLLAS